MIPLTRSQFLTLTGLDAEQFKSLYRRDQLPFLGMGLPKPALEDLRHREAYTPIEAVMMVLADDLCVDGGLERSTAARIIGHWPEHTITKIDSAENATDPIWIASISWSEVFEARIVHHQFVLSGTISSIFAELDTWQFDDGVRPRDHVHRIVLCNLTRAARLVRQRARDLLGRELPQRWTIPG